MKRIGLLSDTHGYLDQRIEAYLKDCDEIWHAGDIGSLEITDRLAKIAPVRAVYGNIDDHRVRVQWPEDQVFSIEGLSVWMTHIGGRPGRYSKGIPEKMTLHKPQLFICGHSHILLVQRDPRFNVLTMNPGAAGVHGFHKMRTLLRFSVEAGVPANLEVVELGPRA